MIRVSDYIADFLVNNGIDTIFSVVGGGAMHMNDSFGHCSSLKCVYQHHEQACSMAAEGYYKMCNKVAGVCVTSGPGAVNALNGVAGAFQDSVPMLVFSGQVKSTLTVSSSGLNLRTLGGQEFDIVSAVSNMTKYAVMITDPLSIRYHLEKALHIAVSDRPGPVWIDIPVDIQGSMVEVNDLYACDSIQESVDDKKNELFDDVINRITASERPVFYAGNGIRIANALNEFNEVVKRLRIPVVTCWDSVDLIESDDRNYVGRGGIMGDRAGNFAVQNSDLVIAVGNRLSVYQVGYDVDTWAREAYVIDVDVDSEELKKPTIRVDMPICMDAKDFLGGVLDKLTDYQDCQLSEWDAWIDRCRLWKDNYPVVTKKQQENNGEVNVYNFVDKLSRASGKDSVIVVSNGSASVVGSQTVHIDKNQRFIMNCAFSSMGYGLPAAVGACIANHKSEVLCIEGDGSVQMNIQELQTVVTYKLPVKVFVINNDGYHQIRQTQNNLFKNKLVGVGPDSCDLGFPDFSKLAWAYDIPYFKIETNRDTVDGIRKVMNHKGYCICEVVCTKNQLFEPKLSAKRLEDGTIISPPLEDMSPFLPREELKANMIIDMLEDE